MYNHHLDKEKVIYETYQMIFNLIDNLNTNLDMLKINKAKRNKVINDVKRDINFLLNITFQNTSFYLYTEYEYNQKQKTYPENYIRSDYDQDKILQIINQLNKEECIECYHKLIGYYEAKLDKEKIITFVKK